MRGEEKRTEPEAIFSALSVFMKLSGDLEEIARGALHAKLA